MAYYPKNKIKTNLQTQGGEYSIVGEFTETENSPGTDNSYSGYYYKLYNGEAYTGRFPGDGENKLLTKVSSLQSTQPSIIKSQTPSTTPPLSPTDQDYENGMFNRYFSKKRNEYLFKELTKDEYDKLNKTSNPEYTLYKPFFIKWMLFGDEQTIGNYNFYSVRNAEVKENVMGLGNYLKEDYLKYALIKLDE